MSFKRFIQQYRVVISISVMLLVSIPVVLWLSAWSYNRRLEYALEEFAQTMVERRIWLTRGYVPDITVHQRETKKLLGGIKQHLLLISFKQPREDGWGEERVFVRCLAFTSEDEGSLKVEGLETLNIYRR